MFFAKYNVAFLASDHASKRFKQMFPDSNIARNFVCTRKKATAIVVAPHYTTKLATSLASQPFAILIDKSIDTTDKSCIILVRTLDKYVYV